MLIKFTNHQTATKIHYSMKNIKTIKTRLHILSYKIIFIKNMKKEKIKVNIYIKALKNIKAMNKLIKACINNKIYINNNNNSKNKTMT